MQKIKSQNTRPELAVRQLVFHLGYRYRLHDAKLPGSPDLVFKRMKRVIFVHGCFWHQHGCKVCHVPKSRLEYWGPKLGRNLRRDEVVQEELKHLGWKVLIIWECETKAPDTLRGLIQDFMRDE